MPGTAVSTRQPPTRKFENYVLTRVVDSSAGLTNIVDSKFSQLSGSADLTGFNIGQGMCDEGYSTTGLNTTDGVTFAGASGQHPFSIGFDFTLDSVTYKSFVASCNGWMALVDPVLGTFNPTEVLTNPSGSWQNTSITGTFSSNAALLAPWFDNLANLASAPSQLSLAPFSYSTAKIGRVTQGAEPPPAYLNSVAYSVSFYRDKRTPMGRRLIVRWSSISVGGAPLPVVRFEAVLYENGTIEFRYPPRSAPVPFSIDPTLQHEGATVGIFMPGGTNRFRDFSQGLGRHDDQRQPYVYGGYAYSAAYTDSKNVLLSGGPSYTTTSANYTISLTPFANWPGTRNGCTMAFMPPVNRRKVLPRAVARDLGDRITLPLVARTGDSRLGNTQTSFDDRRALAFVPKVQVNYPTTMQRFSGGTTSGIRERQDLFTGDFLVTGSIVKSVVEPYVEERQPQYVAAFDEGARHEQDFATLTSSFYVTGSAASDVGPGFDQDLKSKTQVRFSLPVNVGVAMPPATSSIYYYSPAVASWEVPANSTYVLSSSGATRTTSLAGGDQANAQTIAALGSTNEDARGFGPIGNIVSSGSHTPATFLDQTDASIGALYSTDTFTTAVSKAYPKSVRSNSEYSPSVDETFTLPIATPFLIEKAVFEIPLAVGPGWFADQTQCFQPLGGHGTGFDFAGPALTIALHRRVQLGAGVSTATGATTVTQLDLILTGTVTHQLDNTSAVVLQNYPNLDSTFQLRPVGFLAYAGPPGAVIPGTASTTFTGSVTVTAQALSAVGIVAKYEQLFVSGSTATNSQGVTNLMAQTTPLQLIQSLSSSTKIAGISPFGRNGGGFQQAGRCVLGNEHVTLQGLIDPTGGSVPNPFLVPQPSAQQTAAIAGAGFKARAYAAIPLVTHFASPYLAMPGDRFVLSISKMRPYIYTATGAPLSGSTAGHDVTLNVGTINVTLYGSQVQAGVEYHDTLNQPLGSDSMHEIIGVDPILDQFEPAYRGEYSGSFSDNVMLGSLITSTTGPDGSPLLVSGIRDRKLSVLNARNAPSLTTNVADLNINPYKGYRLQPWSETVGSVRTISHVDSSERYFDSMMPSIAACFAANGSGIFVTTPDSFVGGTLPDNTLTSLGWIMFDAGVPTFLATPLGTLTDINWNRSYPFEPRYATAPRQLNVANSLIASSFFDGNTVVPISPVAVSGLMFGTVSPTGFGVIWNWLSDVNLSSKNGSGLYPTGSMNINDTARCLFGFGDVNTMYDGNNSVPPDVLGTNHFPYTRDVELVAGANAFGSYYRYGPIIRGWKYGVMSGIPTFSKSYWRHGRFGQLRDMLEQRPYTKCYQTSEKQPDDPSFKPGTQPAVVEVRFVDSNTGKLTPPESTWSSNLDFECTSSFPFFDGVSTNRPSIIPKTLNLYPNGVTSDGRGNIQIV